MAKKMTFSVSLSLLTKNFQKGIKQVQNSIRGLRAQFQTLVGGLGIGMGIQELVDTAKRLDKAQAVLKNVSGSIGNYGDNLKFVQNISNKYNQDLITLTQNYAKFISAAGNAGIKLEEQRHIFESLTRASAFFNLSADETNGVMLAVEQMISKGRVSTEELRRQLGERLPGAMNLAAQAMSDFTGKSISTAKLDEMIRKGEVLAKDLLPALGNKLNELTGNFNVDTVQGQLNRLKNAFTELVQTLNVGDMFKGFTKGMTSALNYISKNIEKLKNSIIGIFTGVAITGGFNKFGKSWTSLFNKIETELEKTKTHMKVLGAEMDDMEGSHKGGKGFDFRVSGGKASFEIAKGYKATHEEIEKAKRLVREYNNELTRSGKLTKQLDNKWKTFGAEVGKTLKELGKSVLIKGIYAAIAAVISLIVTKIVAWAREQKRIKNLVKDTKEEIDKMKESLGADDAELMALKNTKDSDGKWQAETDKQREDRIKRINYLLRLQGKEALKVSDSDEKINKAIEDRLNLLKEEREYQAIRQKVAEVEDRKAKLLEDRRASEGKIAGYDKEYNELRAQGKGGDGYTETAFNNLKDTERKNIEKINKELAQLDIILKEYQPRLRELGYSQQDRDNILSGDGENEEYNKEDAKLKEEYEKIQKEHNNKLRALNEQLADGAIKQEDYDKALKDLYFSTLQSIYALDNINENEDAFAKAILERVKEYLKNEVITSETNDALEKYNEEVEKVRNQFKNGLITQKELEDEIYRLTEEVLKTLAGFGTLTEAAEELAEQFKKEKKARANAEADKIKDPELGQRDSTFDYKKSQSEITGENADIWKDYAENLEDVIKELKELESTEEIQQRLQELSAELETATANAESFEQAMNFATVNEDIKGLQKELKQGVWGNITNIASAADRLTQSVKNVREAFEDPDISGWEKFIAVFNEIAQSVDTLVSTIQLFTSLKETMDKLKQAEMGYQAVQEAGAAKTLMNAGTTVVAKEGEAMASGTAEAAKMPFPYNLIAIAGIVALIAGIFASLPKFANGGIVKSTSKHGDHNLVRVNGGEMILNSGQQASLFNMLNGKGGIGGNGGSVSFEIRGDKLQGVLNNYNKKTHK